MSSCDLSTAQVAPSAIVVGTAGTENLSISAVLTFLTYERFITAALTRISDTTTWGEGRLGAVLRM